MNEHISITIDYKLAEESVCGRLRLTPEEYFEPLEVYVDFNPDGTIRELSEDELAELSVHDIDSIPRYLHAYEYLSLNPCEVQHTKLTIEDQLENSLLIQADTFWDSGKNKMISRKVVRPSNAYREVIVETLINESPHTMQTVRMEIRDEVPELQTHWIIERHEDGTELLISNKSPRATRATAKLNPISANIESKSMPLRPWATTSQTGTSTVTASQTALGNYSEQVPL